MAISDTVRMTGVQRSEPALNEVKIRHSKDQIYL